MSDPAAFVYVDLDGNPQLAGRLWTSAARGRELATFRYDENWLAHPDRFELEPALALDAGAYYTQPGRALFGALGDSAPDRWGRTLLARAERRRAAREGTAPRTLLEIDYLLAVTDELRLGALRFARTEGGPFLRESDQDRIPPLVRLPALLAASGKVLDDSETADDLRLLLAPGSSLGGARPKSAVRDRDGTLLIAKFPAPGDEISVERWEALALTLAHRAGIDVPDHRLERVAGRDVLLLRRFDRQGAHSAQRVPFLSAMSALGAADREMRSYLEIAELLRRYGAAARQDLSALWRRLVFNVLISNVDDHLRNHGFLYSGPDGWRLSPAYDLNPVPTDLKPRVLSTAITLDDPTASLELAFGIARELAVTPDAARAIAREVGAAVAGWRRAATTLGIEPAEADRMASAFEHPDLASVIPARRGKP